jgi:tetratricopeptide (TPR) repeat protein
MHASRFEIGDYDEAIKSYRKVVEGFRNNLEEKETKEGKKVFKRLIDNSENRTEKIVDFLSKTYSLFSNFGEHYGTHAFEEEGVFMHKLVENLTEYLTKKLKSK